MPRPRPPCLNRHVTGSKQIVWYVRKGRGPRIRLHSSYGSDEFWKEYRAAMEGLPSQKKAKAPRLSLEWALDRYRASSQWAGLSNATRRQRENIYRSVIKTSGSTSLTAVTREAIIQGRERRADVPHAANNFLKAMRGFFGWAVGDGALVATDPTKGVSLLKGKNDKYGFHTWTQEELEKFEKKWPVGTRERLAFDILIHTGLRRGDAVVLGKQHVRNSVITIRTEKTDTEVDIPIVPALAASIAATKTGDLTFLVSQAGTRYTKESFGNWFREACRDAECPGSAHGLRKAQAVRLAESGASNQEMMALLGWSDGKMADHYTKAANRRRLAKAAMDRLENANRPQGNSDVGGSPKNEDKSGA